jgi:hypothetical protein
MRGAIPPFPNTPSWCGAQLKENSTGTALPLRFALHSATTQGSTLKMEAARSSETLKSNHHITSLNFENHEMYLHPHENFKFRIWIQVREQWRDFVPTMMNVRDPQQQGIPEQLNAVSSPYCEVHSSAMRYILPWPRNTALAYGLLNTPSFLLVRNQSERF